jgi:hypothetical protein
MFVGCNCRAASSTQPLMLRQFLSALTACRRCLVKTPNVADPLEQRLLNRCHWNGYRMNRSVEFGCWSAKEDQVSAAGRLAPDN